MTAQVGEREKQVRPRTATTRLILLAWVLLVVGAVVILGLLFVRPTSYNFPLVTTAPTEALAPSTFDLSTFEGQAYFSRALKWVSAYQDIEFSVSQLLPDDRRTSPSASLRDDWEHDLLYETWAVEELRDDIRGHNVPPSFAALHSKWLGVADRLGRAVPMMRQVLYDRGQNRNIGEVIERLRGELREASATVAEIEDQLTPYAP